MAPMIVIGPLPLPALGPREVWLTKRLARFRRFDLTFRHHTFEPVSVAADAVMGFPACQRKQPHNHMQPTRYQRMQPTGRGHDDLPHLEAMVRHTRAYGLGRGTKPDPFGLASPNRGANDWCKPSPQPPQFCRNISSLPGGWRPLREGTFQ